MMMKGRRNCNDSSLAGGFVSLVIFVSHSLSVCLSGFVSSLFCSVLFSAAGGGGYLCDYSGRSVDSSSGSELCAQMQCIR